MGNNPQEWLHSFYSPSESSKLGDMITRREFHTGLVSVAFAAMSRSTASAGTSEDASRLFLNRLTFGASPSELARFDALTLEGWLDAQFAMPVEDQALLERLGTAELLIEYEEGATGQGAKWSALREMRPYSYLNADPKSLLKFLDFSQGIAWEERIRPAREVISASSIRAVHAQAQLREVMTQFWHEHFSVNAFKDEVTAIFYPQYDRVLRQNALGNFRELLGLTTKSPAMLTYLNNDVSKASPANENYARELLELHTLGAEHYFNDLYDDWKAVPGALNGQPVGYIDQDVYEVARAFTGWSIGDGRYVDDGENTPKSGRFEYVEAWHDPYQKRILGVEFAPNAAKMADGERVLDMLAVHPGTARFITGKLLVRLGIERPSVHYRAEIAERFLATSEAPDQIAQVVRAIVLHPEFIQTPPSKLKRPFEFLMSVYRACGAEVTSPRYNLHWWLERAGWTQHQVRPPTGHSDRSADWANTRALNGMVDLALFGLDEWFDAASLDLTKSYHGGGTWADLAQYWSGIFATEPVLGQVEWELIGLDPDGPIPDDPEYVEMGNKAAIALSALTSEFMFR